VRSNPDKFLLLILNTFSTILLMIKIIKIILFNQSKKLWNYACIWIYYNCIYCLILHKSFGRKSIIFITCYIVI